MKIIYIAWIVFQFMISVNLFLPTLTYIMSIIRRKKENFRDAPRQRDFAVIVTAYEQTNLLHSVVKSILDLEYKNYTIYVVADNCDISNLEFNSEKVILLRPANILASNVKSHFYAINRFVRVHECLTIIDSDNIVDSSFLKEMNRVFESGYEAVQGHRKAKNLNTTFACLDEAGDMYYRFIDRKLPFAVNSSASLAGSGMGFTTALYKDCLEFSSIEGAGFDKALQIELLKRGKRIAFAENAIVYDEKTSKADQLIKQRARWINTWFKYCENGLQLMFMGLLGLNWNQFLVGVVFTRPPLFILVFLVVINLVLDFFFLPMMVIYWIFILSSFLFVFFMSLQYFGATKSIYLALSKVPVFIFYQVISLLKSKRANQLSTSTKHYVDEGP